MNKDIIETIKATKTIDELKEVAKEKGYVLSDGEANGYFDMYHTSGKISENELDNVAGGLCRNGRTYSTDPDHYLIVTAGNTCDGYVLHPDPERRWGAKNTCWTCWYKKKTGTFVTYCTRRTYDDDPYNK